MASESPASEQVSPGKQSSADDAASPAIQSSDTNEVTAAPGSQTQTFYYNGRDDQTNGETSHDGTSAEPGGGMAVPMPYPPMPVFPYGNLMPGTTVITRPKRTQCKNACTNCQKACKKCDDNRPCHRCIRYGTTDSCVDSKRKERKKGVKRGPYKKRDSKGSNETDNDEGQSTTSGNNTHGPPHAMPYVGPVGYPPGMWSTYTPGPGGKLEGTIYQPVFALTPVAGQPPHSGDGESAGGGSEAPHFPVGFYPATFISYPGPYSYPLPHGQGTPPHGFHYAFPPPPGVYPHRLPHISNGNSNGDQAASGSATEKSIRDSNAVVGDKGDKDAVTETQVNGKSKVQINGATRKKSE